MCFLIRGGVALTAACLGAYIRSPAPLMALEFSQRQHYLPAPIGSAILIFSSVPLACQRHAISCVGYSRLSLPRRGQGHNRTWARVSLGGLTRGRRRDKEPKSVAPRSPARRITLGGAMREEGVGAGGAAFKGRHGIRYEQTHSDSWLEDVKQEVMVLV